MSIHVIEHLLDIGFGDFEDAVDSVNADDDGFGGADDGGDADVEEHRHRYEESDILFPDF